MRSRWLVFREGSHLRWGGDLRRHYVLGALAQRDDATDIDGWSRGVIDRALKANGDRLWGRRPKVAAATMLSEDALDRLAGSAQAEVLDFHDDPVAQNQALGVAVDPAWVTKMTERKKRNVDAFEWQIVPSAELAALAGLDRDRIVVAGNGSDTDLIRPMAWESRPTVGLISGAAPARGIEATIEAVRSVRSSIPDARLVLWLAATGAASEAYLAELKVSIELDRWIEIRSVPYQEIGAQLGEVWVQVIPNPSSPYWDAVSPVKLYDAMASGRPIVATPRTVMRAELERAGAGLISAGDRAEDLADPILALLNDLTTARRLGQNGRDAAVRDHDWRIISTRLMGTLEARDGRHG